MGSARPENDVGLLFVNVDPASKHERKCARKVAQSHAVKVNRSRFLRHRDGPKYGGLARLAPAPTNTDDEEIQLAHDGEKAGHAIYRLPIRKCDLRPALNALPVDMREWSEADSTVEIRHHLLTNTWPIMAGPHTASAWFQLLCSSKLIYHVAMVAASFHRDILAGQNSWSTNVHTLNHKVKALRLLHEHVSRVQKLTMTDVDRLIFASVTLARHEFSEAYLASDKVLLFEPHFPLANWATVYGRIKAVQAHKDAVVALVKYRGGLNKIAVPGLGRTIARQVCFPTDSSEGASTNSWVSVDLQESMATLRPSYFPCFWDVDINTLASSHWSSAVSSCGIGFDRLSGLIDPAYLKVFKELAIVDTAMDQARMVEINSQAYDDHLAMRNAAVHHLISLPAWDDMSGSDRLATHQFVYEICRVTSVIYSCAVFFSMGPHNGWNRNLTGRLRWLLTLFDPVGSASGAVKDLLLWSVCIGGIAAHCCEHAELFQSKLRLILAERSLKFDAGELLQSSGQFLCSENACRHGLEVMLNQISTVTDLETRTREQLQGAPCDPLSMIVTAPTA